MKFLVLATMFMFPLVSQAVEVKEDSVVCISQKVLKRYERLESENEQDFLKMMRQKAECVEMKAPFRVVILSEIGDYAKIERLNGMELWTNKESLTK